MAKQQAHITVDELNIVETDDWISILNKKIDETLALFAKKLESADRDTKILFLYMLNDLLEVYSFKWMKTIEKENISQ